jgi:outer membrane lipoprotein SlyB
MIAQNVDILITVLPALIGAVSGSLGGNIISNWLKKRDENETVRKDLTKNILYSSKTSSSLFTVGSII